MNTPPPLPSHALRNTFPDIDTKKLKCLYSDHRSIKTLSILWLLGSILLFVIGIVSAFSHQPDVDPTMNYITAGILFTLSIIYFVFSVAILKRIKWGRIAGIILCIFSLPGIPIGTLIGALGLIAFIRSPELFGETKPDPDEIKVEYNYRKKAKKP